MSKPWSPMCQVMRSALSGITALRKSPSANPVASAVTRVAAQPSPNSRNESTVSRSEVSCMCSEQSSRLTTSTRANLSARTAASAARRAGTAAEQPMKPMTERRTDGARPSARVSCKSSPGAEKPVQEATITSVMSASSAPRSATARSARSSAQRSYSFMRAPVLGNSPRRKKPPASTSPASRRPGSKCEKRCSMPERSTILSNTARVRSSASNVRANATNGAWTSCSGTAVPIRLICAVMPPPERRARR